MSLMKNVWRWTLTLGVLAPPAHAADIASAATGVESPYSTLIQRWADHPQSLRAKDFTEPLTITCLSVPEQPSYFAMIQEMRVHAPVGDVAAIIDDFGHYPKLFPGLRKVEVREKQSPAQFVVFWEQIIPVFFISNITFEMNYSVKGDGIETKTYVYRLKQTGDLKFNDGFVSLERAGERETNYVEADFWYANSGLSKLIGPQSLWNESIESGSISDFAVKFKAEHPDWSYDKIRSEAEKTFKDFAGKKCFDQRQPMDAYAKALST